MDQITVLNPRLEAASEARPPAPRLDTLAGREIGFVDNSKLNADLFIARLGRALAERYAVRPGAVIRKSAPKDRLSDGDLERLQRCGAVIQCFGDCGTSTSMSVADGVLLESRGIPTTTVISTAFARAARSQARGRGMGDLPIVEIPHPMHMATRAQIEARAEAAAAALAASLTSLPPAAGNHGPAARGVAIPLAEGDAADQEYFFQQGWTDGLPVVPPTAAKVAAMLACVARDPGELIGPLPPAMRSASIEMIARNAVLAGCRPDYFPVVLAAVEALLDEDAQLYGIQTATNTTTPLIIVNGPIAAELDINARGNCFGQGWRANATIGRAVQLVFRNLGGDMPGETDMATHGQAGKFGLCIAEAEGDSPWAPFHVEAGFRAEDSTVTVIGASAPQNIFTYGCETGPEILDHLVGAVTGLGHNNIIFPSGPLFVLAPEHAHALARDGFGKREIREQIFARGRIPLARFAPRTAAGLQHRRARWFEIAGDPNNIGVADRPEDVHILVAGGAGIHSLFVPTAFSYRPVTRAILRRA
jgi:hypothetical protein